MLVARILFTLAFSTIFGICYSESVFADVIAYPRPLGDKANSEYRVSVNGMEVDSIATVMDVGYAHFGFSGKVRVTVRSSEPIETYDLSPHRLKIEAQIRGNSLTFVIDKPRKLHLRINNLKRFFIFADAIENDAPDPIADGVYLLTDLGVASSPHLVQTSEIQEALNIVASKSGTLYVPRGMYLSGTLRLPSNLILYLAPGSIIKGTAQLEDYESGSGGLAQLRMDNANNVRIFGRGVIDNNGFTLRNQFLPDRGKGRTKMLVANRCKELVIEGIILRDSGVWCIHPMESSNMRFENLKIISVARSETGPDTSHNTDAFDPDNSSTIVMENNFISVDDDAIAVKLKSGRRTDMHDIVFRQNVIWNVCSALKIGTEVHDFTVRDVLFENNDIIHTDTAIVVQCYRGGYVDGVTWTGNHFEQVGTIPNESPHRKGADFYINTRSESSFGEVRNLFIKDNTFEKFSKQPSMIRANGKKQLVENVVIENLVMANQRRSSPEASQIEIDRSVKNVEFR
jgi:polygalacturonase